MKISELIKRLEEIKDAEGDIRVKYLDRIWDHNPRVEGVMVQRYTKRSKRPSEVVIR